jgi:hypothetical protein
MAAPKGNRNAKKKKTKTTHLHVRVTAEQKRRLKCIAEMYGFSVSKLIIKRTLL